MSWLLKKDGVQIASFPFKPSLDQLTRTLPDSMSAINLLANKPDPIYTLKETHS